MLTGGIDDVLWTQGKKIGTGVGCPVHFRRTLQQLCWLCVMPGESYPKTGVIEAGLGGVRHAPQPLPFLSPVLLTTQGCLALRGRSVIAVQWRRMPCMGSAPAPLDSGMGDGFLLSVPWDLLYLLEGVHLYP